MRIDGIIVPLVMSIVLAGCTARINVTHVQPTTKPVRDGVFKDPTESLRGTIYALPRTVVKVKLPIEKTAKSPGKYGAYADLFLPDRKPIVPPGSPAESTLALKRATFSTAGEPDPDNVYAVELAKGGALDQDLTVELTEQGSISGVDVRVENQTSDIILSAISAASGIASRALIAGGAACPADPTFDEFLDCNSLRQSFNGLDQVRRDTLKARYATGGGKKEMLAAVEDFKTVVDLANRIKNLLAGAGGIGGLNPASLLDENRKELDAALHKFLGSKETTTWEPEFEYRPTNTEIKDWMQSPRSETFQLFTFEKSNGICPGTMADLRGAEPPPPALLASSCGAAKKKAELFFRLDSEPTGEQLAAMIRRNYKDPIDPGLRYRIPARMKVTLEIEGTPAPVAEIRLMIAQFGMVAALPATVDSKTINYSIKFYESTGALKSFKLGSKPVLSKGAVDSVSGNVNSILDAEKKKADADKLAADVLTKRTRARQLLEEEQKIRDLCVKLGREDCQVP